MHTGALIAVCFGSASEAVNALLTDVVLTAVLNILIFSIWYGIIDPPRVEEVRSADEPWEETWAPRYADYFFVAFTASIAFSPTDTLPF